MNQILIALTSIPRVWQSASTKLNDDTLWSTHNGKRLRETGLSEAVMPLASVLYHEIHKPPFPSCPPPQVQAHTRSGIFSASPYLWDGACNSLSAGWGCWVSFILIQTREREMSVCVTHPPLCHCTSSLFRSVPFLFIYHPSIFLSHGAFNALKISISVL